jgi:ribosomal protein S7
MPVIKNLGAKRDHLFDSFIIAKFTNSVHYKGPKNKNRGFTNRLMQFLKEKHRKPPKPMLLLAQKSGRVDILTIRVRVAGKFHDIPIPIPALKQYSRFLKCFKRFLKEKRGSSGSFLLATETEHLVQGTRGYVTTQNDRLYEIAVEELSFAHFRWR